MKPSQAALHPCFYCFLNAVYDLCTHSVARLPLGEVIILGNQGNGQDDKVAVSGQGLMTQPVQPKAGKITSCILRIFSSQLTVKNGTLYRWVFYNM